MSATACFECLRHPKVAGSSPAPGTIISKYFITTPHIMREIQISNWTELCIYFSKIFDNLGTILIDDNSLRFSSNPPDVKTELIIHRSGQLVANMPLHGVIVMSIHYTFLSQAYSSQRPELGRRHDQHINHNP